PPLRGSVPENPHLSAVLPSLRRSDHTVFFSPDFPPAAPRLPLPARKAPGTVPYFLHGRRYCPPPVHPGAHEPQTDSAVPEKSLFPFFYIARFPHSRFHSSKASTFT